MKSNIILTAAAIDGLLAAIRNLSSLTDAL
jgi:hypothetical protein